MKSCGQAESLEEYTWEAPWPIFPMRLGHGLVQTSSSAFFIQQGIPVVNK